LHQAGLLLGGALIGACGAFLAGNGLYWRLRAKSVRGTVIGVRAAGKLYYPVYRYRLLPSGKRFEATADVACFGASPRLMTGRKVRLRVFKKYPERAAEASPTVPEVIGWCCLVVAAVAVGFALTAWPVTALTWAVLAVAVLFIGYCLRRPMPAKGEQPFTAITRAAPPLDIPVLPIEEILAGPVTAERRRQQRITGLIVTPILVLVGLGVATLGAHLGRTLYRLQSTGERAHGTVLFSELKRNLHGSTYYPVVQFATATGSPVQFRDRMGSDPPAYRDGEPVDVLYFADSPATTATIDRGRLNWLAPIALCVGGLALAVIALTVRLWVPRSVSGGASGSLFR
jgi:hypothetical protein